MLTLAAVPAAALSVAGLSMLRELRISRAHERELFARGAVAPPDPVYPTMRWGYPATFVAMAIEGSIVPAASWTVVVVGLVVFLLAKALKFWAIASLGTRWSFRVLVLPGMPLVTSGPYRWMRHPNYVAVVGELVGFALLCAARVTGPLSLVFFGDLLRRRILAEERAIY